MQGLLRTSIAYVSLLTGCHLSTNTKTNLSLKVNENKKYLYKVHAPETLFMDLPQ